MLTDFEVGEGLLRNGATGSELQCRGVNIAAGATKDSLGVWSAKANVDAPEVVQGVHEDYLKLGADIVVSKSFWTNPPESRDHRVGGALGGVHT